MKRRALLCLLLAITLLFTACGSAAPAESSEPEETKNMFANSMQKSDPSQDDVFNLLLVGSSGTYYYVEELHGLAKAAGIKMRICNVYYSGCLPSQHYNWWQEGKANYQLFTTDDNGRVLSGEGVDLMFCLKQGNWDAIGMCDGAQAKLRQSTPEGAFQERKFYLEELYALFRKEFPMAKMYWQETSPFEVGYHGSFEVNSYEQQQRDLETVFRPLAKMIHEQVGVDWVPRGDAAQLARANPQVTNITARLGVDGNKGDYYHDGDIGGGQYLTACAWFEVLFGQSCIGNTYRPVYRQGSQEYTLSEEMIEIFQQAAHEAVANRDK